MAHYCLILPNMEGSDSKGGGKPVQRPPPPCRSGGRPGSAGPPRRPPGRAVCGRYGCVRFPPRASGGSRAFRAWASALPTGRRVPFITNSRICPLLGYRFNRAIRTGPEDGGTARPDTGYRLLQRPGSMILSYYCLFIAIMAEDGCAPHPDPGTAQVEQGRKPHVGGETTRGDLNTPTGPASSSRFGWEYR